MPSNVVYASDDDDLYGGDYGDITYGGYSDALNTFSYLILCFWWTCRVLYTWKCMSVFCMYSEKRHASRKLTFEKELIGFVHESGGVPIGKGIGLQPVVYSMPKLSPKSDDDEGAILFCFCGCG